jgi:hypothetical protein
MACLIFGVRAIPGLLMFRWVTVVGLHLCAMWLFVRQITCIRSNRKGTT